jgi:ABC-2 type transport system ATP-binding protein
MIMNEEYRNAVEVHDLEKRFGNFTAVDKISFQIAKGEVFGFLGPNGAGKSTTIKMLCGILSPTSGYGRIGGFDIYRQQNQIKEAIGYMSQKFSLYEDLTIEENIDFYSGIYRLKKKKKKSRKDWILKMSGLEKMESNLTRTLSTGWKQRLAMGCAIIHEPQIVFLDEPTSGVDPIARKNFWRLIREMAANGVTVFVTTHYVDDADNCNRISLIYNGRIIAMGTPDQLKKTSFKGNIVEISVANSHEWAEKLRMLNIISEISLFGNTVHAVVSDVGSVVLGIKQFFEKEKVRDYEIRQILPSLEDVFISLIKDYEQNGRSHEIEKNYSAD